MMIFIGNTTTAQIKIGLPLGMADSSAVLDLSNAGGLGNKGFLLPQVNLSSTIVWGLFGTNITNGMMVFNNATAGSGATAVLPGLYLWAGGKWTILSQPATATASFPYCNGTGFSPAPSSGVLYNNTAYTATYSLGYVSGSGLSYNTVTQIVSGLTLTRVAGTYAAGGGNVLYNLSGTYTGANNGTVSFTMVECGNTVVYGTAGTMDNIRANLTASAASYDAATTGNWVNVTAAEYSNVKSTVASTGIVGQTDADMNVTPANSSTSNPYFWCASTATALPANNYMYGYSIVPTTTVTTTLGQISIASSTTDRTTVGSYATFPAGIGLPATSFIANTRYYYLFKKQTTINGATTYLGTFQSNIAIGQTQGSLSPSRWYASKTGSFPTETNTMIPAFDAVAGPMIQWLYTPTKQW